jgi:hypothetical protein
MVTLETERLGLFVISYGGPDLLPAGLARAADLLRRYAAAESLQMAQFD